MAEDTSSARDFFMQDDTELAAALGVQPAEESSAQEAPAREAPTKKRSPVADMLEEQQRGRRGEAATETEEALDDGGEEDDVSALPEGEQEEGAETKEQVAEIPSLDRKPMTDFSVLDKDGELEIPDLTIKFKAKGEVRELPLDHVVRLAQFGFANEEREQQVLAAKQFVGEAQEREQVMQQTIDQYEQYYQRLFADPSLYEEARATFFSQNSPENRATRAEQELSRVRAAQAAERENSTIVGFVQQVLAPAATQLLKENPLVNEQELIGKYTQLTAPLLRNGRVPLQQLPVVQQLVANDLAEWVQATQLERATVQKTKDTETNKARQQAALAKRNTARVFSRAGGPPSSSPPKQKKFETAKDWMQATFGSPDED